MSNKLTKKDINRALVNSLMYQWYSFNYETMQSPGYTQAMIPVLNTIYEGNDDLIAKKLDRYISTFYNTENHMHQIIMGATIAIEESGHEHATETAVALRTALMGPFAGIGDALFKVGFKVIFGAMAGYMALDGSLVGLYICIAMLGLLSVVRVVFFNQGYKEGATFITTRQHQIKAITAAVTVLGLTVVGSMIPSTVKLSLSPVFTMGEAVQSVQAIIDGVFPYLLPLLATFGVYKALAIKNMTTNKMVWVIIAVCIVLTFFKIL